MSAHVAKLIDRIRRSHGTGKITTAERDELLAHLGRGLERQGRCPECGDRHPVVPAKPADVEKTVRWVATGLPPKRPKSHVTAPPAPQRPLPAVSVAPVTPKERAQRRIEDEAEKLVEARGGRISREEAILEVCRSKPQLYAAYRAASNDPKDRGTGGAAA